MIARSTKKRTEEKRKNRIMIDKLMTDKGISNKELATLTGLHVKTIREIRAGVVKARYSSLRKIYKVLQAERTKKTAERNGVGG